MEATVSSCQPASFSPLVEEKNWYAVYTCPRHEKKVAQLLRQRNLEQFLPLGEVVHHWRSRTGRVQVPLFPSYVFVRMALSERLNVLTVPNVIRLVGFNGRPSALPDSEIAALKTYLSLRLPAEPHPYLTEGTRVRINDGPFSGQYGFVVRNKGGLKVVLSLDLIMRSVLVEVPNLDVEIAA